MSDTIVLFSRKQRRAAAAVARAAAAALPLPQPLQPPRRVFKKQPPGVTALLYSLELPAIEPASDSVVAPAAALGPVDSGDSSDTPRYRSISGSDQSDVRPPRCRQQPQRNPLLPRNMQPHAKRSHHAQPPERVERVSGALTVAAGLRPSHARLRCAVRSSACRSRTRTHACTIICRGWRRTKASRTARAMRSHS